MRIFLFAGAGASVELGVPAMGAMARQFISHLRVSALDASFVDDLVSHLDTMSGDLELLIDDLDTLCAASEVLPAFGRSIDGTLSASAKRARAEAEWFVQHSCERVHAEAATLLWGPVLRSGSEHGLTIATTNYDRGIELAAQRCCVDLDDGFGDFTEGEWAPWTGLRSAGHKLLKLHGSTDWYQVNGSSNIVKLRHPMPLFGGVALQVGDLELGALGSALVLPSREKRKNQPPFPQISHEMFVAASEADAVVFIGSSLRDADVRALALDCSARVPTMVVGPDFAPGDPGVPAKASVYQRFAAEFLMSDLPMLLQSQAWPAGETIVSGATAPGSVLDDVLVMADGSLASTRRCEAIERLWRKAVKLGEAEIGPALGVGVGPVACDALALVDLSRERDALIGRCRAIVDAGADEAFARDFALLDGSDRT